jgi:hypothetical protein
MISVTTNPGLPKPQLWMTKPEPGTLVLLGSALAVSSPAVGDFERT